MGTLRLQLVNGTKVHPNYKTSNMSCTITPSTTHNTLSNSVLRTAWGDKDLHLRVDNSACYVMQMCMARYCDITQ